MNRERLFIYVAVGILSFSYLAFNVIQRQKRHVTPVIVNPDIAAKDKSVSDSNGLKNDPSDIKRYSSRYMEQQLRSAPVAGRTDPFALLPQEKIIEQEVRPEITQITEVNFPVPADADSKTVKGILIGEKPIAYIEAEDGSLRRVTLGDIYAGGIIREITPDSLVIRRDENWVTKKLGE